MNSLIHIANVVYLASYAVKDMRVLRWLTIVGIVLLIPYYLSYDLWAAASWNGLFLGINLYRLKTANNSPATLQLHDHEKSSSVSPDPCGMCSQGNAGFLSRLRSPI